MRRAQGPRRDGAAYHALQVLRKIGGAGGLDDWFVISAYAGTIARFEIKAVEPLIRFSMVRIGAARAGRRIFAITEQGDAFLAGGAAINVAPPAVTAGPRFVPERRPLNAAYSLRVPDVRDGCAEYRDIPSRFGGTRRLPGQSE